MLVCVCVRVEEPFILNSTLISLLFALMAPWPCLLVPGSKLITLGSPLTAFDLDYILYIALGLQLMALRSPLTAFEPRLRLLNHIHLFLAHSLRHLALCSHFMAASLQLCWFFWLPWLPSHSFGTLLTASWSHPKALGLKLMALGSLLTAFDTLQMVP